MDGVKRKVYYLKKWFIVKTQNRRTPFTVYHNRDLRTMALPNLRAAAGLAFLVFAGVWLFTVNQWLSDCNSEAERLGQVRGAASLPRATAVFVSVPAWLTVPALLCCVFCSCFCFCF